MMQLLLSNISLLACYVYISTKSFTRAKNCLDVLSEDSELCIICFSRFHC